MDKAIALAQIMAGGQQGGAEAYFEKLCHAFAGEAFIRQQQLFLRPHTERLQRLAGFSAHSCSFGGMLDFTTKKHLKRSFQQNPPDVALAWMNRAARFTPAGSWKRIGRLGGYYDLKYYRDFDLLVGNTPLVVDYMIKAGWPAAKTAYIPNFCEASGAEPIDRDLFNTPQDVPLLLLLARLHPVKAVDIAIQAMKYIPDAYLWIAGEGNLRGELEKLAQDLAVDHRIRFLGWRENKAALMQSADVCVFPSRFEPLGNVIIEAFAEGLPVVAADSDGPRQLIEHGDNGLLVPIDAPEKLAEAVCALLQNKEIALQMAARAQERARLEFSRGVVMQKWYDSFLHH